MTVPLQPRLQSQIAVHDITIVTRARRLPQPSQIAASLDAAEFSPKPISAPTVT